MQNKDGGKFSENLPSPPRLQRGGIGNVFATKKESLNYW